MTTDDLSRDLEAIQVPSIPNDYASLKALIQTLPSPLSPEIRSATTGGTNTSTPGTAAAQNASVMAGAPIGVESGSTQGVVSELFYGQSNDIKDATLEQWPAEGSYVTIAAGSGWTAISPGWNARYTLLSGTTPTSVRAYTEWARPNAVGNSNEISLRAQAASAPFSLLFELESAPWLAVNFVTAMTSIVAAIRVASGRGNTVSTMSTVLKLLRTSTVVGTSPTLVNALVNWLFTRLVAAWTDTPTNLVNGYSYKLRVESTITYDLASTHTMSLQLMEPQIGFSASPTPPPYTPQIGSWIPGSLTARNAAIFDPAIADRLGIKGVSDATAGGLVFGSGKDTNLYRSAADTLKTDDSLAVAGKLILPPTSTQTLAAGTTILANAAVIQIDSAGSVTLTATPTIADGVDGQLLTILNVDSADTINLQDQGSLGGSNLRLTATYVGIGPRDSIQLMYSSTIGDWVQIGALVSVL